MSRKSNKRIDCEIKVECLLMASETSLEIEKLKKCLSLMEKVNFLLTEFMGYHARIRVMNYHKELKKAGDTLFHADYRGVIAFQFNHFV